MTVHVASLNTRAATELCIRTMRQQAEHDFELVVGDSGSSDGSVEMLEELSRRGWLTLQRAGGRGHADWLDAWRAQAPSRYLVFVDSDVDFRRRGWLRELIEAAAAERAALVAVALNSLAENVREPVSGRLVRLMPAPATWLFLIDAPALADLDETFTFRSRDTDSVPEGCVVYDTGAALLERMREQGHSALAMGPQYQRLVKHYGSLTWMPLAGEGGRRKRRNLAVIERRLRAVRALDEPGRPLRHALARLALSPSLEDARELAARLRWRAARALRRGGGSPVFAEDFSKRSPEETEPPRAPEG